MIHFQRIALISSFGLLVACGSGGDDDAHDVDSAAGGAPESGGRSEVGGVTGKSGVAAAGGLGGNRASTGGTFGATGGVVSTSGGVAGGGVAGAATSSAPDAGGETSRGGSTGSGGVTGRGGSTGSGGSTSSMGGQTAKGGTSSLGGATAKGGTTATGGASSAGEIRITDRAPGFASVSGGTTGGGTQLSSAITVSTMSALQAAVKGSNSAIILVEPGTYEGTLNPGSNKTIIGKGPGVLIKGNISMSGSTVSNLILRNLAVRGLPCSSYDECKAGADAVYIGNGAHHIWLDHLDISDGQDGNCDITQGADYVTVSWSRFYYTYAKEHRFSNLIAGSDDEPNSQGKLHITYMNSHWGERVDARQPRGRYGNVHMLNNYHATGGSQIHGVGKDLALIAENCVYHENRAIWTDMGSPRGWKGIGNEGTATGMNTSTGTVFTIPYAYTPLAASKVVAAVTSANCGAGNTCKLAN
ncbi:MAG: hypothetical protein QM784_07405 [Polyangiaceae bacterium]